MIGHMGHGGYQRRSWEISKFNPVGDHNDGLVIGAAVSLTRPTNVTKIIMQATSQNIRYVLDGSIPTATRGFQLASGDYIIINFQQSTELVVIEEAATADLQYQWGN